MTSVKVVVWQVDESSVAELKTWFGQMEIPSGQIFQGRLILKLSLYFETTYHFNFSRFFPNFCPRFQYSISFSCAQKFGKNREKLKWYVVSKYSDSFSINLP